MRPTLLLVMLCACGSKTSIDRVRVRVVVEVPEDIACPGRITGARVRISIVDGGTCAEALVDEYGQMEGECTRVPVGAELSCRAAWLAGDVEVAHSLVRFGPLDAKTDEVQVRLGPGGVECSN